MIVRRFLSATVITLAAVIGLHWAESFDQTTANPRGDGNERNERSTPREFILPATPAVAFDQEMRGNRASKDAQGWLLARCARRLIVLGYDVGDEIAAFNAKLAESVFLFQESHHLPATGKLDARTAAELRC